MASLAPLISSLKPQPINPSSHKLLGFNYLSTQLTLNLSPTHQPFYSTTRPSNYFTAVTYASRRHPPKNIHGDGDHEDEIVDGQCEYEIFKLEEPGNTITKGVCTLRAKEKKFDFGEHGSVSVEGCLTGEDTYLRVSDGSGIFERVQGKVKLQKRCNEGAVKLFYTFYLKGFENLRAKL